MYKFGDVPNQIKESMADLISGTGDYYHKLPSIEARSYTNSMAKMLMAAAREQAAAQQPNNNEGHEMYQWPTVRFD